MEQSVTELVDIYRNDKLRWVA